MHKSKLKSLTNNYLLHPKLRNLSHPDHKKAIVHPFHFGNIDASYSMVLCRAWAAKIMLGYGIRDTGFWVLTPMY